MLYLIGLGLNEKGISLEGLEALKKCRKIYLEGYTVDFPYQIEALEKNLAKKIEKLERSHVESNKLVNEAKKHDIALLVYGCPLFATTHLSLVMDAKKEKVETKIIHAASVFDSIGETGLQLYKFGKTTSMPAWKKNFIPDSFLDVVRENQSINAHTLILVDMGLGIEDALHQLKTSAKKKKIKLGKIVVCSRLGTKESKIYYDFVDTLQEKAEDNEETDIELPFCIIIPGELHFLEKECLENL